MDAAADPARRCEWASGPEMIAYHDEEWGVPVHGDRPLFEFLVLEGAQAGLSWSTILKKRSAYREAFAGFDPETVAAFSHADQQRLLGDPGIVRNRLKVAAAVENARALFPCGASSVHSTSLSGVSCRADLERTAGGSSPTFLPRPKNPDP